MSEKTEGKWVATAEEASSLFDVDIRTLQRWAQQGRILKTGKNQYDISSLVATKLSDYAAQVIELKAQLQERTDKADLNLRKLQASVNIAEAEAEMKTIELNLKKGKLVDYDEIARSLSDIITACRNRLLGIPSKLALRLSGMSEASQIQVLLSDEITEALNNVAEDISESASE